MWGAICEASTTEIPFSITCKAHDGVMVHHIVTAKHHRDKPKSFMPYSQTLVNLSLTKPSKIHN